MLDHLFIVRFISIELDNIVMTDQLKGDADKKVEITGWWKTTLIALAVLGADLICIWYFKDSLTFEIGGTGTITFFGILILSSHFKKNNPDQDVGAVRQALAGSLFVVYFVILGISMGNPGLLANDNTVLKGITDNFWAIILSVVAFYFGSQGAQSIAKALKS